ncbi:MAG TPA: hypothetical protein VJH03_16980 [Blastocatellia bacterium]|nr:hypothetical protein [Blastocatellia bacterium]
MRTKNKSIVTSAILVLVLGLFSLSALAQHEDMVRIGKKGIVAFDTPVRVGDTLLKPAKYQIQHVVEGEDHVIVFKRISQTGSAGYISSVSAKETMRLKCRLEPLGEKARHGGMRFGTNAAGEKTLEEVHIQGENVKHVF